MMGEYPPLSDEEIMAITLDKFRLESGADLGVARIAVEFTNPPTGT